LHSLDMAANADGAFKEVRPHAATGSPIANRPMSPRELLRIPAHGEARKQEARKAGERRPFGRFSLVIVLHPRS
jgi:hypothetical protein